MSSYSPEERFRFFLNSYRQPEKRLEAAEGLMHGVVHPHMQASLSRIQLAARWGLPEPELKEVAFQMYDHADRLLSMVGEMALTFVRGSLQDLHEAEGEIDAHFIIRAGFTTGALMHDASRATTGQPSQAAPFLRHAMGIPAHHTIQIEADVIGEPNITDLEGSQVLPAWSGMSPVINDGEFYKRNATSRMNDVVIGTAESLAVMERLDELTGRTGLLDHMRGLAEAA